MKKFTYKFTSYLVFLCTSTLISQQRAVEIERNYQPVKKNTMMARFEPELTISAKERERMKAERFAEIKLKMEMLDTMDISQRKREKLLVDIINKPFSTRLSSKMSDSQFEEEK